MRKVIWVATQDGKMVGVFPTKKKAAVFFGEDVELTKLVWNGFYHSEKPLEYDPYATGTISIFDPMF
jgi:hypothetical protein